MVTYIFVISRPGYCYTEGYTYVHTPEIKELQEDYQNWYNAMIITYNMEHQTNFKHNWFGTIMEGEYEF